MKQLRAAFKHAHKHQGFNTRGLSCIRKKKYATEDDAYDQLRFLLCNNERKHTPERSKGLCVNRCKWCGWFHLGRKKHTAHLDAFHPCEQEQRNIASVLHDDNVVIEGNICE